ncbi:MAG: hypothetical protein HS126_30745 [Anaerolineales bacterium]|nr:hypothetical protein [Anaerolineales bacterium]
MRSDLRSFTRAFSWQGQPPRLAIQNPTAIMGLAGLAGLNLAIYLGVFVLPYYLFNWYQYPRLSLRPFARDNPVTLVTLVWAFLVQGGLYWLGWRLALQVRGRAAWLVVLGSTVAFYLALLFLYPIDAVDIFENIMHARISSVYGANPFLNVARQFPGDPFYPYLVWRSIPSVYGPLWEMLAAGVVRLAGNDIIANVLAFKVLNGLFLAISISLVAAILRRMAPERALAGVVLLAWNPVVLYETIGNGHNDIVMAVWLLAAAWAIISQRYTLAILALVVGALVKFIPLLLIPVAGLIALRTLSNTRARLHFLAVTTLAAAVLIVLAYGPYWHGLESLAVVRRAEFFTSSLPAVIYAWLKLTWDLKDTAWKIGLGAAGITALFVLWQSDQAAQDRSWLNFSRAAFKILMFYLLVTCLWFQQWYAVWPLAIAALLPPGPLPRLAVLFSFAATSKHLVFGPLLFWAQPPPPRLWAELFFGPAVLMIPWLYVGLALWLGRQTKTSKDQRTGET